MSNQVASTLYESWMTNLAANQGAARKRIIGGLAAVLGDRSVEWMVQANLEHLPSYASPQSIALIASERQLDTYPGEATTSIAARAPFWLQLAKFRGTALGVLLGLHFAGFDGAVWVQQNGQAMQLSLPLPTFDIGTAWDPTPNLITVTESPLIEPLTSNVTLGRIIPANFPWWTFDSNTDFCSRFALLYNAPSPAFYTVGRATFTASKTATLTWSHQFADTTYLTMPGNAVVTDGNPGVVVSLDGTSLTTAGATVNASDAFTGWVDVLACQASATNPFVDPHAPDLARLQSVIRKWRPAKATCVGVYVVVQDACWGRPIIVSGFGGYQLAANTWGDGTNWGPSTVVSITGSF